MIDDPLDVLAAVKHAIEQQANYRTSSVEIKLHHAIADSGEIVAAVSDRGMKEHCGLAAIEFIKHGQKHRIAPPLVAGIREKRDAIAIQRVEGVLNLLQRRVHALGRQCREKSEALRIHLHGFSSVLVGLPRECDGLVASVIEVVHGNGERKEWRIPCQSDPSHSGKPAACTSAPPAYGAYRDVTDAGR